MCERSKKDAARCYRKRENAVFAELARLLPLPPTNLDKASVIRLTSSYLKMRQLFSKGLGVEWGETSSLAPDVRELSSHFLQSLYGFVFVLAADAKIIYVSETVSLHLGLSQVELTGNSIYDFIHYSDYEEMKALLAYQEPATPQKWISEDKEVARSFCLRMICFLAEQDAGFTSDGYKVIHCRGYLKLRSTLYTPSEDTISTSFRHQTVGLVAVGHSLPSKVIIENKISNYTFMFRARLDMTIIHLDSWTQHLTGYDPQHLMDRSLYKFIHPDDCLKMRQDHVLFLTKGQAITSYYRLMARSGGWIWIQSLFTTVRNLEANRQIRALNYLISEREYTHMLLDREQLQEPKSSGCNQNNNVKLAKPTRLSSRSVNNAMSQPKMDMPPFGSSLIRNPIQAGESLAIQTKNILSNEVYGYPPMLCKNDSRDPQLQSAPVELERFKKSYPAMYDCSDRLFHASLPSLVHNVYQDFKPEDSLNISNCPVTNSEINANYNSTFDSSVGCTNNSSYNNSLVNPKFGALDKAAINSVVANSLSTASVYSRDVSTKDIDRNSDFSHCDEELPYVEKLHNQSSERVTRQDAIGETSISDSASNYIKMKSDLNCDICPPGTSFDIDQHDLIKNFRDCIYGGMSSGLYMKTSDLESVGCQMKDVKSPQPRYTSLTDQKLSLSSGESPSDMYSNSCPVYLHALNNFTSDVKYPLIDSDDQPVVSPNREAILATLNNNKKGYFDTSSAVTNDTDYAMGQASPINTLLTVPKAPNETFNPLSFYGEMNASTDPDNEQKHLRTHFSSEYSSGFCDYASQCTLSSPGMSDSFSDAKSSLNSHTVNEKVKSPEIHSAPRGPNRASFYTLL